MNKSHFLFILRIGLVCPVITSFWGCESLKDENLTCPTRLNVPLYVRTRSVSVDTTEPTINKLDDDADRVSDYQLISSDDQTASSLLMGGSFHKISQKSDFTSTATVNNNNLQFNLFNSSHRVRLVANLGSKITNLNVDAIKTMGKAESMVAVTEKRLHTPIIMVSDEYASLNEREGSGGPALFNDSQKLDAVLLTRVLSRVDVSIKSNPEATGASRENLKGVKVEKIEILNVPKYFYLTSEASQISHYADTDESLFRCFYLDPSSVDYPPSLSRSKVESPAASSPVVDPSRQLSFHTEEVNKSGQWEMSPLQTFYIPENLPPAELKFRDHYITKLKIYFSKKLLGGDNLDPHGKKPDGSGDDDASDEGYVIKDPKSKYATLVKSITVNIDAGNGGVGRNNYYILQFLLDDFPIHDAIKVNLMRSVIPFTEKTISYPDYE